MKNVLLIIALLFLFGSCLKEPDFHSYQINLVIDFGQDFPQDQKNGAKVTLINQLKNYTYEAETDKNGKVQFSSLEPGFYSVTISHSFSTGNKKHYYNGQKNIDILANITETVEARESLFGVLVIKEYYFSGRTTPAGKAYSNDQYIEIFNNSSEIQYADGISVLEHESYATGENFWTHIHDTIVVKMIWTIPGDGKQVPIKPGKSIILARTGINHREDPNGNPLSPVNLGNADFEFYVLKQPEKDIDSPNVPNLVEDLFVLRGDDAVFYVKGGSAIALAKLPCKTKEERKLYLDKNMVFKTSTSGSSTKFYPKIANSFVLDAVEVVMDDAHAIYKRLPSDLDIGYTYVNSGSGSGKCVRRMIKEVVAGRVVYQDTNNSTEDFLKDVDPKPKIYE